MNKSDKPTSKATAPIIDVARPNESAPSATSISVIVNNRPILRDPMMVAAIDTSADEPDRIASVSTKINIQPSENKNEIKNEELVTEVAEPKTDPLVQEEQTAKTVDHSENSIVADNQSDNKNELDDQIIETQEQAKHDAEISEIIESKRYYLPIDTVEKRRTKRFVLIGASVSILLILIWIDVALDAGLIKLGGLKAVTHIFST